MPKSFSKFNPKIAIIGGSGLRSLNGFKKDKELKIKTPFGSPSAPIEIFDFLGKKIVFLTRQAKNISIPPHKINHRANIWALKKIGIKYIFGFNSVGSLKKEIKPGRFLIPSDFIDFDSPTFYDKNPRFITPQLSEKLRKVLIKILRKLKIKFYSNGIYFNTKGPRLETKAEIKMIKNFADVVAMTMAKEAVLANEARLEYVAICSVDNYANGLLKKPLTIEEIFKKQLEMKKTSERIIKEISKLKL